MDSETAERIRQRCRDHWPPITQARLARRLDLDATALSRMLSGERRVPEWLFQRIAEIFGCDVADLMSPRDGVAA